MRFLQTVAEKKRLNAKRAANREKKREGTDKEKFYRN